MDKDAAFLGRSAGLLPGTAEASPRGPATSSRTFLCMHKPSSTSLKPSRLFGGSLFANRCVGTAACIA